WNSAYIPGEARLCENLEQLTVAAQLETVVGTAHHRHVESDGVVDVRRRFEPYDRHVRVRRNRRLVAGGQSERERKDETAQGADYCRSTPPGPRGRTLRCGYR